MNLERIETSIRRSCSSCAQQSVLCSCSWIINVSQVTPRLQKGPTCGLVALTIAATKFNAIPNPTHNEDAMVFAVRNVTIVSTPDNVVGPSHRPPPPPPPPTQAASKIFADTMNANAFTQAVDQLLARAQDRKYSSKGEIFTAQHLADLAISHFGLDAIMEDWKISDSVIVDCLRDGGLVLVAYDKDGNHEPCCKKGAKAHWALINGVGWKTYDQLGTVEWNLDGNNVRRTSTSNIPDIVLCTHGKSLHQAVWSYSTLFESSWNLECVNDAVLHGAGVGSNQGSLNAMDRDDYEIDAKEGRTDEGYVLPNPEGILTHSLAGKLVLVYPSRNKE